jgi:hypothetical protein
MVEVQPLRGITAGAPALNAGQHCLLASSRTPALAKAVTPAPIPVESGGAARMPIFPGAQLAGAGPVARRVVAVVVDA